MEDKGECETKKEKCLLAFSGYKQSGKDTAANFLMEAYDFKKIAFATPLKITCAATFRFSYEQLYDDKLKEEIDPRWGFSPRQALQKVGTELFRDNLPKYLPVGEGEIWKKSFEIWLKELLSRNPKAKVAIVDCRYPDEAHFLRNLGFSIVRIKKEGQDSSDGHCSETSIDLIDPDMIIHNNGKDEQCYYKEIESTLQEQIGCKNPTFTGTVNVSDRDLFVQELMSIVIRK